MSKSIEDGAALTPSSLPLHSSIDTILAEAADSMMAEVCSQGFVTFVLITLHASCLGLAILRRTSEEVCNTAIVHLNRYCGLKKRIYWGPPSFLGCSYILK
jgi:hypothetical protein